MINDITLTTKPWTILLRLRTKRCCQKFNTPYAEGVIQREENFLQNSLAGVSFEHRSRQCPYQPVSTFETT